MKISIYSLKCRSLITLVLVIGSYGFSACNQAEQKAKPVAALPDSTPLPDTRYDSSQTPYICAMRSLKAAESGDIEALTNYVHPTKGLTITHVAETIENHEYPFSIEELKREAKNPATYTILNGYDDEDKNKSTLSGLLQRYTNSRSFPNDKRNSGLFSKSEDVRRNYTGNGSYSLFPPLGNNQTAISYHFSDSTNEMGWEDIVLRTETYEGKDYLVEILRAFWTP